MKMYQIEYLLATVESGSISRAAEDLMVSRPSVSRALRELEEEFGVEIPSEDLESIVTVGDVITYLKNRGVTA